MNMLMKQQEEQYEITRDNIDMINQKCHDLKHQVRALRGLADDESKERYLKELEQSVEIYGAIVKTGNDVLDTILTEKSLSCQAKGIRSIVSRTAANWNLLIRSISMVFLQCRG